MHISTILDHIDSGHMALPEFQRGYVWNREQVRGLFDSLYRRHPVGSLLVWATTSNKAQHRGDGTLAPGIVKLLLDGQQRMTSLYGVLRGKPPKFFDGNSQVFTNLRFHLERQEFEFYQPIKMQDDPLWIDVTTLMQHGHTGLGAALARLSQNQETVAKVGDYAGRLSKIIGIAEIDLHIEEVTGEDKTIEVVVDIFNKVNSGGTMLSQGDLALAKICGDWPEAREQMKTAITYWAKSGLNFNLDWLLRNINTVVTGEAKFQFLHSLEQKSVADGLKRAITAINQALNLIDGRLGLDHDQVLFGRYAIPVMSHYLDRRGGQLTSKEQDKLLFWFIQSSMWGRFSGSTESYIDRDLALLEHLEGGLDRLIAELRLWHGSLMVEPGHFTGWSLGARFYPVLYMLTRIGQARDWGTGLPLKKHMLGSMSKLEVHHIFPKTRLYNNKYQRAEVNAVANFCFLTKGTNLNISDTLPEQYFPQVEEKHPGVLASQWIPMDPLLWKISNYADFLDARRELLAGATNRFMLELLHEDAATLQVNRETLASTCQTQRKDAGCIAADSEERVLVELNKWIVEQQLPVGKLMHELAAPDTGSPMAILDLAWPNGLQEGFSQPVAVLLNEGAEVVALANRYGYLTFTAAEDFLLYVKREVIGDRAP